MAFYKHFSSFPWQRGDSVVSLPLLLTTKTANPSPTPPAMWQHQEAAPAHGKEAAPSLFHPYLEKKKTKKKNISEAGLEGKHPSKSFLEHDNTLAQSLLTHRCNHSAQLQECSALGSPTPCSPWSSIPPQLHFYPAGKPKAAVLDSTCTGASLKIREPVAITGWEPV